MSPDALIKSDKSNLYNNYTKLHGTHVLQIIFAVSANLSLKSAGPANLTTVQKRRSKAQKRDFAYTLVGVGDAPNTLYFNNSKTTTPTI